MQRVVISLLGPSQRPAPYQELALAVILQAVRDAVTAEGRHRNEARLFLAGNAMLAEWCGVAGIDPEFVKDVVRTFLETKSRGRDVRQRSLCSAGT